MTTGLENVEIPCIYIYISEKQHVNESDLIQDPSTEHTQKTTEK